MESNHDCPRSKIDQQDLCSTRASVIERGFYSPPRTSIMASQRQVRYQEGVLNHYTIFPGLLLPSLTKYSDGLSDICLKSSFSSMTHSTEVGSLGLSRSTGTSCSIRTTHHAHSPLRAKGEQKALKWKYSRSN